MSDYAKVRKILKQHQRGLMTINEAIEEISAMLGIPLIPGHFDNPFEVGQWVQWAGNPSSSTNLDGPCQNGLCVGKVAELAERTTWVKWERTCPMHHESLNQREPAATDCLRTVVNPFVLGDLIKWPVPPKTDNRCKSVSQGIRCTSDESHNPIEPAHVGDNGYVWYDSDKTDGPRETDVPEHLDIRNPAVKRALNDPIVDCCGRDVADCDCPDIADYLDIPDNMILSVN